MSDVYNTISSEPIDGSELESESDSTDQTVMSSSTFNLSVASPSRDDDLSETGNAFLKNELPDVLQSSGRLKFTKKKRQLRKHPYVLGKKINKTIDENININKASGKGCDLHKYVKNQDTTNTRRQTRNRFINYSEKIFGYLSYPINMYTAYMFLSQFNVPAAMSTLIMDNLPVAKAITGVATSSLSGLY